MYPATTMATSTESRGGLTQLSLGMQELPPVALSAEAPSLLDSCRTIYTDAQMQIIENYPDSTAAKILIGSAQTLLEGTDAYASARGYYTYIYQPGRAGWQTVAVIGPEISDDEPKPQTHRAGNLRQLGSPCADRKRQL